MEKIHIIEIELKTEVLTTWIAEQTRLAYCVSVTESLGDEKSLGART